MEPVEPKDVVLGMGLRDELSVRSMLSTEDRGYRACNVGLLTLQLNWPAAHTLGELLHTNVLFCPSSRPFSPDELVEDPDVEAEYADAQALAV